MKWNCAEAIEQIGYVLIKDGYKLSAEDVKALGEVLEPAFVRLNLLEQKTVEWGSKAERMLLLANQVTGMLRDV